MSCSMLYKSGFVTKSVVAVFSHAMEVSLMFSVVATLKSTILIEPLKNGQIELLPEEMLIHAYEWKGKPFKSAMFSKPPLLI